MKKNIQNQALPKLEYTTDIKIQEQCYTIEDFLKTLHFLKVNT